MASETTKAYNNLEFLSSPEARTIRMLSEYIHPIKTFAENKIEGTIVFLAQLEYHLQKILNQILNLIVCGDIMMKLVNLLKD